MDKKELAQGQFQINLFLIISFKQVKRFKNNCTSIICCSSVQFNLMSTSSKQRPHAKKIGNQGMKGQQRKRTNHRKVQKQITFLGCFFLLLTLTYSSFSTIITFIYQQYDGYEYLGPLLLITNYGAFMFCNLLAPYVKINYKKQFLLGALCYTINYVLQIPNMLDTVGVLLMILGSVMGGAGAAIIYVAQGGFVVTLLENYQIKQHYKGRYFGMLNMIVFSNILLGSLVTTFGLGFFGDSQYFIILAGIGGLSILFGLFFLQDVQQKNTLFLEFKDQDQEQKNGKLQPQPAKGSKGIIFRSDMKFMTSIKQIYKYSKKMRNFMPMIITDGVILGFISSSATHLLPQDHYSKVQAGIFLVVLGVGAIIGGFFSGFLSDKFPILKVGKSSFFVLGLCMFLCLPVFMQVIQNFAYSYFLGLIWGFGWHYMDGWLLVACSKIFQGRLQSFALNKFIHSLSFMIYQLALILYGSQNPLLFIQWFFFILIALIVLSLFFIIKQENQEKLKRVQVE